MENIDELFWTKLWKLKIYSMNKRLKIIETILFILIVEVTGMLHNIYCMKVINLFLINQISR